MIGWADTSAPAAALALAALWQAAIAVVAIAGLAPLCRSRAELRYAVLRGLLALMIAGPIAILGTVWWSEAHWVPSTATLTLETTREVAAPGIGPVVGQVRASSGRWDHLVVPAVAVWVLGCLLLLARYARRLAAGFGRPVDLDDGATARVRRRLIGLAWDGRPPFLDRVVVSAGAHGPRVQGLTRASIVLPLAATAWSDERLRVVHAHETEHLCVRDQWVSFAALATLVVFWANPLSWIFARALFRERECACDERAIRRCGTTVEAYFAELLGVALEVSSPPLALAATHSLRARVRSATRDRSTSRLRDALAVVTIGALVGAVAVSSFDAITRRAETVTIEFRATGGDEGTADGTSGATMRVTAGLGP